MDDHGSDKLSSSEVFPSATGCTPPSLPEPRYYHVSFLSQEPENPRVVVCGGRDRRLKTIASCLVLNQETQTWDTE